MRLTYLVRGFFLLSVGSCHRTTFSPLSRFIRSERRIMSYGTAVTVPNAMGFNFQGAKYVDVVGSQGVPRHRFLWRRHELPPTSPIFYHV